MDGFTTNENPADVLSRAFIVRYKYELLASFVFIALIGGIVFGMQLLGTSEVQEPVVINNASSFKIVVDIGGAILSPGVYELESGSRVQDVIDEAGGFLQNVDDNWVSTILNQAEVLVDGQKIVVPFIKETLNDQIDNTLPSGGKINLNSASIPELTSLPGIGNTYAQRIVDNRPYRVVDDLLAVPGIGPSILESIRDLVGVY